MARRMSSQFSTDVRRVDKPWGYELVFALTETYCGKILFVRAGQALSLQYHEVKDEAWYVESGTASLELGTVGNGALETVELHAGDALRFRPGTIHRVTAVEDTTIVEVSTPHLDDVVRLEDRYGREGTSAP
jgi:mannose-6-phosphate isomerase-like protein (cupin superfamily)